MIKAEMYKKPNGFAGYLEITEVTDEDSDFFNDNGFNVSLEQIGDSEVALWSTTGVLDEDGEEVEAISIANLGKISCQDAISMLRQEVLKIVNRNSLQLPLSATPHKNITLEDAVEVCKDIYCALEDIPVFPALTGGTLYKEGPRKDIDILFYRVRQEQHPPKDQILITLSKIGFTFPGKGFNWVVKSQYKGFDIDLFFPELYPDIAPPNKEDLY